LSTGLLLSFVGFPVRFLVVRVTGVVFGVVVVGGLVVGCLLGTSGVGLAGFLSLSFPVSGIHILGLNSHKVEGSGFAIVTSRYFVLEAIRESLVEPIMKGSITPVTAGS
jgi:hypothetical protein